MVRGLVSNSEQTRSRGITYVRPITARSHPSICAVDQIIGGRFRVVSTLGQGGMGEVYEAFDLELHEGVALKTIKHDIASDSRFIERFKHEVQRSRTISHSNVCRVYDLFRERTTGDLCDADVWFLTMELLRGETLSDRLRRDGRMETAAALPLVSQMCDALDAAHGAGVVHRDFKSGNVMLVAGRHVVGVGPHDKAKNDSEIRVVVTDFGLARPMSAADESTCASDDLGNVIGTPARRGSTVSGASNSNWRRGTISRSSTPRESSHPADTSRRFVSRSSMPGSATKTERSPSCRIPTTTVTRTCSGSKSSR